MIPSSPRLVAFAQSECDLTTPSVFGRNATGSSPILRRAFGRRGTRQRQGRPPLIRFLRLGETGRRLKEAPPDRCHAVKPYRSSKLRLQGRRVRHGPSLRRVP
jgi:hypothetical protein